MTEVEVAVVGAGAAGIAAAKRLRQAGVEHLVLEAGARLGGRAWTDHESFPGIPFDRGCHWLHSASENPLRALADELGFKYDKGFSFSERRYLIGDRQAGPEEAAEIGRYLKAAYRSIYRRAAAGEDLPLAGAVDRDSRWYPIFAHLIALQTSGDTGDVSLMDYAAGQDTEEDYPVEAGLGALLLTQANGIAVRCGIAVREIDGSGRRLVIRCDDGELVARSAIVTVSTGVLASGAIKFTPDLPLGFQEAIAALPLGAYEKVAFQFSEELPDLPRNCTILPNDPDLAPISFVLRPFGRPMAVAEIGGTAARDLGEVGEAALLDFAACHLERLMGSDLRRQILRSLATSWTKDPFIRGAYSYAKAGKAALRQRLREPHQERVFFAGEATSPDCFATCHGAYQSGIAAAERALASLS